MLRNSGSGSPPSPASSASVASMFPNMALGEIGLQLLRDRTLAGLVHGVSLSSRDSGGSTSASRRRLSAHHPPLSGIAPVLEGVTQKDVDLAALFRLQLDVADPQSEAPGPSRNPEILPCPTLHARGTALRLPAHGLGPRWIAIPSSSWTATTYSLPGSGAPTVMLGAPGDQHMNITAEVASCGQHFVRGTLRT